MVPHWLSVLAVYGIAFGIASSLFAVADIISGRRQRMAVMNVVWPLTLLWSGPVGLWFYATLGRARPGSAGDGSSKRMREEASLSQPAWMAFLLATTHCGSGCALGDLLAESVQAKYAFTFLGRPVFAAWILDFVLAFLFGILFQYFTIKPMKGLGRGEALKAALKADTLSLTAWQVGMYGWMALCFFLFLKREIPPTDPVFWFLMQIGMAAGFLIAFPVNAWLVKSGIKERMHAPAYPPLPDASVGRGPVKPIGPRPAGP